MTVHTRVANHGLPAADREVTLSGADLDRLTLARLDQALDDPSLRQLRFRRSPPPADHGPGQQRKGSGPCVSQMAGVLLLNQGIEGDGGALQGQGLQFAFERRRQAGTKARRSTTDRHRLSIWAPARRQLMEIYGSAIIKRLA